MSTRQTARWVLAVLFSVNLINYVDRQILYALLPLIQTDMHLSDAQAGRLASAFMIVYMFAAPPIAYIADRMGRKIWIAVGIALWSMATAASGLAATYRSLFGARAAVGIGEACYGAISPSFVAEHYPPERRASALALFSMAIPVGSALGYIAGGALGQAFGWRRAFLLVGLPGFLLAALSLRLREPLHDASLDEQRHAGSYPDLFRIPSFALATLAGAALTFTLGGFAVWMPSFFHRAWGMGVGQAGTLFGAVTVISGVLGSLAGGWLSDWTLKITSKAHFLISGLGLLIGMPLAAATLLTHHFPTAVITLFFAEFFLFLNMGPLNAVIVSVTQIGSRSMAFAANILVIHALGDALSPALIGAASDHIGLRSTLIAASSALGVAGLFCLLGMRYYDDDHRKILDA